MWRFLRRNHDVSKVRWSDVISKWRFKFVLNDVKRHFVTNNKGSRLHWLHITSTQGVMMPPRHSTFWTVNVDVKKTGSNNIPACTSSSFDHEFWCQKNAFSDNLYVRTGVPDVHYGYYVHCTTSTYRYWTVRPRYCSQPREGREYVPVFVLCSRLRRVWRRRQYR